MIQQPKAGAKLATPLEAADYLNVKPATLESWRIRGGGPSLPYIKVGRAVRYRWPDLHALVDAGVTQPPKDEAAA